MGVVNYNLVNGATLGTMAPPALGGGAFGPAALPAGLAGAGMYIIVNAMTNNRYIGISNNLAQRFNARLETVTELGFSAAQMNQIAVFWGLAQVQSTALGSPLLNVVAYGAPLNVPIDGVAVNLERLLIRFVLTQLGAGGTVSNNMLAFGAYVNPTPNPITVTLAWGNTPLFAAGAIAAIWPAGVGW